MDVAGRNCSLLPSMKCLFHCSRFFSDWNVTYPFCRSLDGIDEWASISCEGDK